MPFKLFFSLLNQLAFDAKSWKASLRIPQRRPRTHCFVHSRWRRLAQTGRQNSVFFFPSSSSQSLALTHAGVNVALLQAFSYWRFHFWNTNWCDWTSLVKMTCRFVVLYIWNAAAFSRTAGSVCVNDSNVYMNHYQGLYQDYLNMMPLKHVIAFIYNFLFFIFNYLILFDVV